MRKLKFLLPAFLAALAGCSTNPVTGRSQFIVVSERQAIGESAAAYNAMMGQLGKKKQIEAGTPRAERVREITDRLIAQAVRFRPETSKWSWEVQVINDPKTVNAWCMAGGKMAIYTGMWERLKATDDEIAQVMGHEIGHALANHTQERMSVAMGVGVATSIAAIAISSGSRSSAGSDLALTGVQLAAITAITLPNSREGESEADQIGIELAARAGYDPRAAVTLWDKMGKLGGGKGPPEFLSTHPSAETRSARLRELVAKVDPYYQQARANPASAPRFLGAAEASNERIVTKPGEMTRQEYAAKVSQEAETMTFLSERFERFKRGETVLECRAQCVIGYTTRRGDWKKMHERRQWRDLALSVTQVGYLSDLSYFLLAESAAGLGLKPAAAAYYRRALEAGKEYGCGDSCEGLDVQKKSFAALGSEPEFPKR
jgi:predicted Zn-dependent protease